jgi:maltose operon protein
MQLVNGSRHYTVPPEVEATYRAAPNCCASPAQFAYAPLSLGQTVTTAIDETTPAYEFESGKSYFLAYRLPETRAAFSVEILSPLAAGGSYAFHPEVLLLDEKYVVVRRVDPRTFNFSGIQFAGPSHIGGTIAFPASGSPRSEKYMLVLTTESLMKLTTSERDGSPLGKLLGVQIGFQQHTWAVFRHGPMTPAGLTIRVSGQG